MAAVYTDWQASLDRGPATSTALRPATRDSWVIARWSLRKEGGGSGHVSTNPAGRTREGAQGPMRNRRIVRTLVLAGTAAMLSALSLITTVMAATGGGDFPLRR